MHRIFPFALLLSACTAPQPQSGTAPAPIIVSLWDIETDATGSCFARTDGPTQTKIIEELIEVAPETRDAAGTVVNPAVFRTITRPQTVKVGEGTRFETVCPPVYTAAFVSTLQRALLIRRVYDGPITGQYDAATSLAVQSYQRGTGIDSPLLGTTTARELGILAVPRR
jgi:peptidoglycan hydrolase-like protein with peptidoglycan-binding domain